LKLSSNLESLNWPYLNSQLNIYAVYKISAYHDISAYVFLYIFLNSVFGQKTDYFNDKQ